MYDMISEIRNKLAAGEASIGCWLTSASALAAEAMASLGFDWLAVDMEHGAADIESAISIFAAAERHGATPFVRLPSADPYLARRLLDAGAEGLIIPVVESADDFAEFARHCHYPPAGTRGVGLSRANQWGDRFDELVPGFRPFLVPQIETMRGVAEAEAIIGSDLTDAVFIGPYDLSASMGAHGDFSGPEFQEKLDTVLDACRRFGKAPGIHQVGTDLDELRAKIKSGFRFVAYGTDLTAMRDALKGFGDLQK
jgi:2-keto-3-deoxy-L-rhamnonate aldolase RhmA